MAQVITNAAHHLRTGNGAVRPSALIRWVVRQNCPAPAQYPASYPQKRRYRANIGLYFNIIYTIINLLAWPDPI